MARSGAPQGRGRRADRPRPRALHARALHARPARPLRSGYLVTRTLLAFAPVAAVLSPAPPPATALVVRNAARGGRRQALLTTVGNSIGVLAWGVFAAAGIAAIVAASANTP